MLCRGSLPWLKNEADLWPTPTIQMEEDDDDDDDISM